RRRPARRPGARRLRRLARVAARRRRARRRGRDHRRRPARTGLRRRRARRWHRTGHRPGRPHPACRAAGRRAALQRARGRAPSGNGIPVLAEADARGRAAGAAARARRRARPRRLRLPPAARGPDDRPGGPDLRPRRPLVRARLQVQPPAALRRRRPARGDAAQRVRPAGAGLHPRAAPLAALPPRRRLRLRTRLRRHPLRLLPRNRTRRARRRSSRRVPRPLRPRTRARARRAAHRRHRGGGMSTVPLLDALVRAGALRTIDHALAQSLRRLDPATPDSVLAAAALASLAVAQGHAGFDPSAPQLLVDDGTDHDIPWPDPDAWRRELAASRWVSTPGPNVAAEPTDPGRPLVLEGAPGSPGLLYLRRYREYERRVAVGLQRLAAQHAGSGGVDLVTGG